MIPKIVHLGGNRFVDCQAPLGLRGEPLVSFDVEAGELFVDLNVPAPPALFGVSVRRNRLAAGPARVDAKPGSVTVTSTSGALLLFAIVKSLEVSVVALDLRVLGLMIWADGQELHLGGAVIAGNAIQGGQFGVHVGAS